MRITQSWSGRFDEGTESYIPMNAPDYMTISELTVSDQNGSYDTVPERAMAMAPQIYQFMMNRQMTRAIDRLDDGKRNGSVPMQHFDIPEPFGALAAF